MIRNTGFGVSGHPVVKHVVMVSKQEHEHVEPIATMLPQFCNQLEAVLNATVS